jgi:hypothetical protein
VRGGLDGLSHGIVTGLENPSPSQGDLVVGPLLGDIRSIAEHEMKVIAHHGIATNLHGEEPCQLTHPTENPFFAVAKVLPGVGVDTTEEGPPDAAGNAVINADLVFNDDPAPGVGGHQ